LTPLVWAIDLADLVCLDGLASLACSELVACTGTRPPSVQTEAGARTALPFKGPVPSKTSRRPPDETPRHPNGRHTSA